MRKPYRIRVRGAFLGKDMEFVGKDLCIENTVNSIIISSASRCTGDFTDCDCIAAPLPINMHVHVLDNIVPEYSTSIDVDEAVGKPGSEKHRLLDNYANSLSKMVNIACNSVRHYKYGGLVEFREKLSKELIRVRCKKPYVHIVLGRGYDKKSINDAYSFYDGLGLPTPLAYSTELLKYMRERKPQGRILAVHIAETLTARVNGDLELAIKYLKPDFIIHGNYLSRSDIDLLARNNISVVICPRNTLWFGLRVPDIEYMLRKNVILGVGTDNAGLQGLDLWSAIQDLVYLTRVRKMNIEYRDLAISVFIKPYVLLGIGSIEESELYGMGLALISNSTTRIEFSRNPWLSLLKRTSSIDVLGVIYPDSIVK